VNAPTTPREMIAHLQHELSVANNWIEHHQNHVDDLIKENATLRAALDQQANYQRELKADRDRLDWLAVTNVWFDEPATESYTPETFRAEIDRKRKDNP
jgi:hypothetical protein